MGERKVLNKYYPPDFDPAKIPRNKRPKTNDMKVRMMLPMSVRCRTCGNFMYKGTKFNTRKEDVLGEDYLGIQIFRFYYRCTNCAAEFTMKTDPKSSDYLLEEGASRNYEPWRDKDVQTADVKKQREEEEMGNAMKALENRTIDSKKEMDIMSALDEMRSLNARHNKVTTEQALEALQREAQREASQAATEEDDLPEDEREELQNFMFLRQGHTKRLEEDDDDSEGEDAAQPSSSKPSEAGTSLAASKPSSKLVNKPALATVRVKVKRKAPEEDRRAGGSQQEAGASGTDGGTGGEGGAAGLGGDKEAEAGKPDSKDAGDVPQDVAVEKSPSGGSEEGSPPNLANLLAGYDSSGNSGSQG